MSVETFYIVVKGTDGSLVTYTEMPEEPLEPARTATTVDIYETAKQITHEVETSDLVARISAMVAAQLKPQVTNVANVVGEALKERGINPESVAPTE